MYVCMYVLYVDTNLAENQARTFQKATQTVVQRQRLRNVAFVIFQSSEIVSHALPDRALITIYYRLHGAFRDPLLDLH